MLPNCYVLTVPKTGSTSLYESLLKHPQVCLPLSKETWFFDSFYEQGLPWLEERFSHYQGQSVICDFSSKLLYEEGFTRKLRSGFDDIRIIVLLRDPIDRCVSHFQHEVRRGIERSALDDALQLEPSRLQDDPDSFSHVAYRAIGALYKIRLEELLSLYDPEAVHVVLLEELIRNERTTIDSLCDFLEIERYDELNFEKTNVARRPRSMALSKLFSSPEFVFQALQSSQIVRRFTPKTVKRKTRVVRGAISRNVSKITEFAFEESARSVLPTHIRQELIEYYGKELAGLDVILKKDLAKYWNWWNAS